MDAVGLSVLRVTHPLPLLFSVRPGFSSMFSVDGNHLLVPRRTRYTDREAWMAGQSNAFMLIGKHLSVRLSPLRGCRGFGIRGCGCMPALSRWMCGCEPLRTECWSSLEATSITSPCPPWPSWPLNQAVDTEVADMVSVLKVLATVQGLPSGGSGDDDDGRGRSPKRLKSA